MAGSREVGVEDAAIYRAIITSGASTGDAYINNSIQNSPGAHVGHTYVGLNERETRDLVERLFDGIKRDAFADSLRQYFAALREFGSKSSYKVLLSRFPEDVTSEEVYVPLRGTNAQGTPKTFLLSEAIGSAFGTGAKRIFVEGSPGSGKSTLIRQVARHAWDNPASVGLDRSYIALPLRLRSLAQVSAAGREDRIWAALNRASDLDVEGARPPAGFYEAWSRELDAPWLLLLDGFDEVSEECRDDMFVMLDKFVREDTPLLLTSRPVNSLRDKTKTKFQQFHIEPFSVDQQQQLIKKWFADKADDFQKAFARFANGELGGTPLLLTIAAIVYYHTGSLPTRRSKLYRDFVNDPWHEALKRGANEELGADFVELAPMLIPLTLNHIALTMTERRGEGAVLDFGGGFEALKETVTQLLKVRLNLPEAIASFRAERLVRFLGSRSGVLTTSAQQCEWLHPTFREFLAAEAIVAESNATSIVEVLKRFNDVAWRQVASFLIAILSEKRSVLPELKMIKELDPPVGAAFAAVAISEGATVDLPFTIDVIRELSSDVLKQAKPWICERLLTRGDGGKAIRDALNPFMRHPELATYIATLKEQLITTALHFGKSGSCAIHDLKELGADDALTRIAQDTSAPQLVRADAAEKLYELGHVALAGQAFAQILAGLPRDFRPWPDLVRPLARTDDIDLFINLATNEALTGLGWGQLLDALKGDSRSLTLETLVANERLPASRKLAVDVRLIKDAEEATALLRSVPDEAELIKPCVLFLQNARDTVSLLQVATGVDFSARKQLLAVRALRSLQDVEALRQVVNLTSLPYRLRRQAAEALYRTRVDRETATVLLTFFEAVPEWSDRLPTLTRNAFCRYILGEYEQANDHFQKIFRVRPGTSWELGITGHCLEMIGQIDGALGAYNEAIQRGYNTFARARRAYVNWEACRYAEAVTDVDQLGPYSAPPWFAKFAGDTLRELGRYDDADDWFSQVLEREADSPVAHALNAHLVFDRGTFGAAIAGFRKALELNPSYLWARRTLARVLRVAEQWDAAVEEYSALSTTDQANFNDLLLFTAMKLRIRRFDEADRDLASLRGHTGTEPFVIYLEAISKGMQGDKLALTNGVSEALAMLPNRAEDMDPILSNRALFLFVLGESEQASQIVTDMISAKRFEQLRFYTAPFLDDIHVGLLPHRDDIQHASTMIKRALWPDGFGMDFRIKHGLATLRRIVRNSYPFPMYCNLWTIGGLEQDRGLGAALLDYHKEDSRTIALWTLGRPDRVYGQCNFKQDPSAEFDLKFCERTDLVLSTNLRIFVEDYDVERLLFLEQELLDRFRERLKLERLAARCVLVEPPPRFKPGQ